ncbi:hypothetical protein JMJ77_0000044, partial [Colletotrichum scovillei]
MNLEWYGIGMPDSMYLAACPQPATYQPHWDCSRITDVPRRLSVFASVMAISACFGK